MPYRVTFKDHFHHKRILVCDAVALDSQMVVASVNMADGSKYVHDYQAVGGVEVKTLYGGLRDVVRR